MTSLGKMASVFRPVIVKQTNPQHSGTVIFFHGSGDNGDNVRQWVRLLLGNDLKYRHLQIVYPTAPLRPYTPLDGAKSNVWFDRLGINPEVADHKESIHEIGVEMVDFIKNEIATGIPLNRIILGGFSMGGCLTLQLGFRYLSEVAGLFSLSSFLGNKSLVYDELKDLPNNDRKKQLPVFMCHGDLDDLVPIAWGRNTYDQLKKLGVPAEFHSIKNTLHELQKEEIKRLNDWILKVLPPLPTD